MSGTSLPGRPNLHHDLSPTNLTWLPPFLPTAAMLAALRTACGRSIDSAGGAETQEVLYKTVEHYCLLIWRANC